MRICVSVFGSRCHAEVVKVVPNGVFVGNYRVDGTVFEVYRVGGVLFNPFNFVAVKKGE